MRIRNCRNRRSGSILVLSAFVIVLMFGMVAFALDIGYLGVTSSQLQASADAAALAAAWELIDEQELVDNNDQSLFYDWIGLYHTRNVAHDYAGRNLVARDTPSLSWDDIDVGYLDDPTDPDKVWAYDDIGRYNTVRVRVRRTDEQNGEVALFFAKVFGIQSSGQETEATAMFLNNIAGFTAPSNGENLGILPFTLDVETWNAMLAGTGTDLWAWDEESETISSGSDGILEVNLLPEGDNWLAPGNRGAVDIGDPGNGMNDVKRQVVEGISEADLAFHGGVIELDANGELELNGDTGAHAGVKAELASIKGQPRVIPLYSGVPTGNGNNAEYTIVKFVGIRILDIKLTGKLSDRYIAIQPAKVMVKGGVAAGPNSQTSDNVYSPVWLVK